MLFRSPPRPSRSNPWLAFVLVFVFAAGLTFTVVAFRGWRAGAGIASPQFLENLVLPAALDLRIDTQGDRLLVAWDRTSQVIRSAASGKLEIADGSVTRTLDLDVAQLAAGQLLYKPASNDVNFRLEVRRTDGSQVVETMRVLDAIPPPPPTTVTVPPAAVPAPQTTAKPDVQQRAPAESESRPHTGGTSEPTSPQRTESPKTREPAYVPPESTPSGAALKTPEPEALRIEPPPSRVTPNRSDAGPVDLADAKALSSFRPALALKQVMPDMRDFGAGQIYKPMHVEVQVTIDRRGHVRTARVLANPNGAIAGIATMALRASRQWLFEPATLHGRPVESEHIIRFDFAPSAGR